MNRIETPIGIPLYVIGKDDDVATITDDMAYLVAKDGLYIKKTNRLYSSITQIKEVECLGEVEATAQVKFTKMSLDTFQGIETFFADIYKKFESEVAILLYYSFDKKDWGWLVPEQKVGSASADYEVNEKARFVLPGGVMTDTVPDEYKQMGSIHSHAKMSAFHSGTDDKDEFHFDGLHITIGGFNATSRSYAVRWIVSGVDIKSEIMEVVEGYKDVGIYPTPLSELVSEKVTVVYNNQQNWSNGKAKGGKTDSLATDPKSSTTARKGAGNTPTVPKSVTGAGQTTTPPSSKEGSKKTNAGQNTSGINTVDADEVIELEENGIVIHE